MPRVKPEFRELHKFLKKIINYEFRKLHELITETRSLLTAQVTAYCLLLTDY